MRAVNLLVIALVVVIPVSMKAQSSSVSEIDELKAQMKAQQKLLREQQAEIQTLKSALATQQKMLVEVVHSGQNLPAWAPAVHRTVEVKTEADRVEAPQDQVIGSDKQPL